MEGTITAVIPPKRNGEKMTGGFGFIRDSEGQERFFHARDVRGVSIEELQTGASVTFEPLNLPPTPKNNGFRATNVSVN